MDTTLMKVMYLGTNTLVLNKGKSALLVDPHFSRPGVLKMISKLRSNPERVRQGLRQAGISSIDGVLLTHTHYDHAMDVPEVIRQVGGEVFGSASAINIVTGSGLPAEMAHSVICGRSFWVGEFSVCFHDARHIHFPPPLSWIMPESGRIDAPLIPPAPFWAYRCGEVFAIQVDQTLIFGSAGFVSGAYQGIAVEKVILAVGGLETKPRAYLEDFYAETVLTTGAACVWLSHWDNFLLPWYGGLRSLGLSRRTVRQLEALGEKHGQSVAKLPFGVQIEM